MTEPVWNPTTAVFLRYRRMGIGATPSDAVECGTYAEAASRLASNPDGTVLVDLSQDFGGYRELQAALRTRGLIE